MSQTENEARVGLDALGAEIRATLTDHEQAAYVRWEPHNGTAYELVLVPWEAMEEAEEGVPTMFGRQMGPGWVWVSAIYPVAASYPIRLWDDGEPRCPHASYLGEHLAKRNLADGAALNLLLSAVAGDAPTSTWEDADIEVSR